MLAEDVLKPARVCEEPLASLPSRCRELGRISRALDDDAERVELSLIRIRAELFDGGDEPFEGRARDLVELYGLDAVGQSGRSSQLDKQRGVWRVVQRAEQL